MILTLDVGNSQLYGGLFEQDHLKLRFRKANNHSHSSDEYGLFLKAVLRENQIEPHQVMHIVMASVVPEANHSLSSACIKYFNIRPLILQAGLKTGLKIKYRNPLEVGADRIANSLGAVHLYPNENILIADLGTATTICVLSKQQEYLGGIIAPGLSLSMETLEKNTAKLPTVEIKVPDQIVGRSTIECIQSGLFYSAYGMIKEVIDKVVGDHFADEPVRVIGTGGFSSLFEQQNLFDVLEPDLVLIGLRQLQRLNK